MTVSSIAIHPLQGALIAGVLHTALGPDHLCTIVTLSACQGLDAFWLGARWAGAHIVGLFVVGLLVSGLKLHQSHFDMEVYEHYMDYAVGTMLVLVGSYFIIFADRYFDAEWAPKQASCACHAHLTNSDAPHTAAADEAPLHSHSHHSHAADADCEQDACGSRHEGSDYGAVGSPSLGKVHKAQSLLAALDIGAKGRNMRQAGSLVAGFLQGIACPAGLVGITFLRQYNFAEMCIFVAMFFVVTSLCMGALAATYGSLTRHCVSSAALGRCIYYGSCVMSLALGCVWLVVNATIGIDQLLGHDHGDHDHHHVHQDHTFLIALVR